MATSARPRRAGRRALGLLALGGLLLCLLVVGLRAAVLGGIGSKPATGCGAGYGPSERARGDVPGPMLRRYVAAGRRHGLGWEYLAAVGSIETDHGRLRTAGVLSGENFAGAGGPMQFLGPTWRRFGVDGDGDGRRDRYDPDDAVPGAANLLRASGAPENWRRAIFAYNHADWYVADVERRAAEYRGRADAGGLAALTGEEAAGGACAAQLAVGQGNGLDVLRNPRIDVYPGGQADLRAGRVDPRVTSLLLALAERHTVTVTSLQSGHSILTTSGNRSNHADGRAVDIGAVDSERCTGTRIGACGRLAVAVGRVGGEAAPSELIYAFDPDGRASARGFARPQDHSDHVHVGFSAG